MPIVLLPQRPIASSMSTGALHPLQGLAAAANPNYK
jgi:hypothetical protein